MPPLLPLTIGLIAIASLALLLGAFSWLVARHLCRPRRRNPGTTPDDYHLPFREEIFYSGRTKLRGWFIPVQKGAHLQPTVVLCHGWSSTASRLLPLAKSLHEAGFAVFLYDTRGHGRSNSGGPVTGLSFAEDLRAAIDALWDNHQVDPYGIAVIGHSVGAYGAIMAASMDPRIRAVVSCSAFADPKELLGNLMSSFRLPRWPVQWLAFRFIERWTRTPMSRLATIDRINKVRAPLFLLHGGADRIVSPSNLHRLAERAVKGSLTQWVEPTSGHSDYLLDPVAHERIVSYLQRHLVTLQGESSLLDPRPSSTPRRPRLHQVCTN